MAARFRLYGVGIESDTNLLGVAVSGRTDTEPEITIRRSPAPLGPTFPTGSWSFRTEPLTDGSIRLCASDVCEVVVSPARNGMMWREGRHNFAEATQSYLLGAALSYCLIARGLEPVHGTAVMVNGEAIGLLGDSGYGKSTLAAGFLAAGHQLITDDILVPWRAERKWRLGVGVARLKLYPAVRDALLPGRRGVKMNPFTEKEVLLIEPLNENSVPLRALYVLPRRAAQARRVSFRKLNWRAAFFSLVRNTFNDSVTGEARLRRQFEFAQQVAREVPVRAVRYPKRIELVPEVVRAIVADAAGLVP